MTHKQITVSAAQGTARVAVANSLATALFTSIDELAEEGTELTQIQKIHLGKMHIMAYGNGLEIIDTMSVDAMLESVRDERR